MDPLTALQALSASPLDVPHVITTRQVGAYTLVDYTPRSFLVTGDTEPIKEHLKNLGGKFNWFEVHKGTGQRVPGWVYSKTRLASVERFLQTGAYPNQDATYRRISSQTPTVAFGQAVPQVTCGLPAIALTPDNFLPEATYSFMSALTSCARPEVLRLDYPAGSQVILCGATEEIDRMLQEQQTLDPTLHVKLRAEANNTVLLLLART